LAYRPLSTRRALYKPSGTEEQRVGESEIKTEERDRKKKPKQDRHKSTRAEPKTARSEVSRSLTNIGLKQQ